MRTFRVIPVVSLRRLLICAILALCAVATSASAALRVTVKPGDTLGGIAARHGVSTTSLARFNGISIAGVLSIGRSLAVPWSLGGVNAGRMGSNICSARLLIQEQTKLRLSRNGLPDGASAIVVSNGAHHAAGIAAPFTSSSTVSNIPLPAGVDAFEDVGISADSQLAILAGGSITEPAIFVRAPFNSTSVTSSVPISGEANTSRGRGSVRFRPPGPSTPTILGNISTRLRVETGDNALIGGFIVTGTQSKNVIVRAIGPSLSASFPGTLADPVLELHDSTGGLIASNDNWRSDQEAEIIATTIPPSNDLESAIVATLPANNSAYTAIVRGVNNGTGIGVVEAYDLDRTVDSKLANISTRGLVQTGDNVMIGGLIVLGQNPLRVIVRAIGPSLPLPGALGDPTLELHDGNGALIASNDNWRTDQEAEIIATTIPPSNDLESAIVRKSRLATTPRLSVA